MPLLDSDIITTVPADDDPGLELDDPTDSGNGDKGSGSDMKEPDPRGS